ncbi:ATP-binding protein [Streptomyces sp. NPDC048623]|uniref:ATP-binding protein n=1 Tax=Streptomyces sp. NPDC048623 TaxID=3155761 RepID=UPI00341C5372
MRATTLGDVNQKNSLDFRVQLSPTPRGARLARLLAGEWLRTREVPYAIGDAALQIVAELAANAVTHGRVTGRDFLAALMADEGTVRIEVTDTKGDRLPAIERGLGLVLVEALADRWGVEVGPVPRKTVWAELDLVPSPEPGKWDSGGSGGPKCQVLEKKGPHQTHPFPPGRHRHPCR